MATPPPAALACPGPSFTLRSQTGLSLPGASRLSCVRSSVAFGSRPSLDAISVRAAASWAAVERTRAPLSAAERSRGVTTIRKMAPASATTADVTSTYDTPSFVCMPVPLTATGSAVLFPPRSPETTRWRTAGRYHAEAGKTAVRPIKVCSGKTTRARPGGARTRVGCQLAVALVLVVVLTADLVHGVLRLVAHVALAADGVAEALALVLETLDATLLVGEVPCIVGEVVNAHSLSPFGSCRSGQRLPGSTPGSTGCHAGQTHHLARRRPGRCLCEDTRSMPCP